MLINQTVLCHAMLLCGTCDLLAKAMVYNMTQFNGNYGCSHCLQSGKQLAVSSRRKVHIYPYMLDDPSGPSHTSDQLLRYSQEAIDQKKLCLVWKAPAGYPPFQTTI